MTRTGSGTNPLRATFVAVALAAAAVGIAACEPLPPAPPGGEGPTCSDIRWGSTEKRAERMSPSPITGVRAGRHHCYDRVVIDLRSAPAGGWTVRYHAVEGPGSGEAIPVRGTDLEVVVRAPTYDDEGHPTFHPADASEVVDVSGYATLRQVVYAGSFEGVTEFGVGVRARLPFRVFALEGPSGARLVIDVAHAWS
jgi:hypothetical protein